MSYVSVWPINLHCLLALILRKIQIFKWNNKTTSFLLLLFSLCRHARRVQLLHQKVIRCKVLWILLCLFKLVEVSKGGHRCNTHIVPQVVERGRRNTPLSFCDTVLLNLGQSLLLDNIFRSLGVDHFMESRHHITTGNVFKCRSGLDEQAALGNFHSTFFPVSCPD